MWLKSANRREPDRLFRQVFEYVAGDAAADQRLTEDESSRVIESFEIVVLEGIDSKISFLGKIVLLVFGRKYGIGLLARRRNIGVRIGRPSPVEKILAKGR